MELPAGFAGFPTAEPASPKFGKCDVPFEILPNGRKCWRVCPTLRPPTQSIGFTDLTGRRVGKLFVMGLFVERRETSTAAQWVVKCDCGSFELRHSGALRSDNDAAECYRCEATHRPRVMRPRESVEIYALRRLAKAGGFGFLNSKGVMQAGHGTPSTGDRQKGGYFIEVPPDIWMKLMAAGKVQLNEDGRIGLTQKGRRAIAEANQPAETE